MPLSLACRCIYFLWLPVSFSLCIDVLGISSCPLMDVLPCLHKWQVISCCCKNIIINSIVVFYPAWYYWGKGRMGRRKVLERRRRLEQEEDSTEITWRQMLRILSTHLQVAMNILFFSSEAFFSFSIFIKLGISYLHFNCYSLSGFPGQHPLTPPPPFHYGCSPPNPPPIAALPP